MTVKPAFCYGRMFTALAFVPPDDIISVFNELKENTPEGAYDMIRFMVNSYFYQLIPSQLVLFHWSTRTFWQLVFRSACTFSLVNLYFFLWSTLTKFKQSDFPFTTFLLTEIFFHHLFWLNFSRIFDVFRRISTEFCEMVSRRNGQSVKWSVSEMVIRRNGQSAKWFSTKSHGSLRYIHV